MKKLIKNRKGAISNVFELIASVIYYVILFTVFFILFTFMTSVLEQELDSNYLYFTNDISASAYLKTPVSPDGNVLIYDLMQQAIVSQNYTAITDETEKIFQPFIGKFWHITVWGLKNDSFGKSEKQKIMGYYDNQGAYGMLIAEDNKPQEITDLNSRQLLNIAKKDSSPLWVDFDKMFVFRQIPLEIKGKQKEALLVFAMGEE
ncbi:hypothetical protein KY336_00790 [Candidatus Woesearchaeota archaeon]|nr:hypothetical protein [Candidatus Woesearchaeota archaeon]